MHRLTMVVPVLNEVRVVARSVCRLTGFLGSCGRWDWEVVVADNGSQDGTWGCVQELTRQLPGVRGVRLDRPGRGAALRQVWRESSADLLAYTDVDLSTDLRHLPELADLLISGSAEVAVGSRLLPGAQVRGRRLQREVLSRGYNHLTRWITGSRVHDHQCGFKALLAEAAADLLPRLESSRWFFDTELLVLAQRRGWQVGEIPVHWVDDPDSRVRIWSTVIEDLQGLWRLRRRCPRWPGSIGRRCKGG